MTVKIPKNFKMPKDVIEIRVNPKLFPNQSLIYFDKGGAALDMSFVTQKELDIILRYYLTNYNLRANLVYLHPDALCAYNTWAFK